MRKYIMTSINKEMFQNPSRLPEAQESVFIPAQAVLVLNTDRNKLPPYGSQKRVLWKASAEDHPKLQCPEFQVEQRTETTLTPYI